MFVCEKIARGHRYLYLVESVREGKRVRQRTIRALGRKDVLQASGELDRLIASLARHSERAMVLSDMAAGHLACVRIGGPLLFGRLWERLGLGEVVTEFLDGRGFGFDVERAVFVSVLHRLFVSGSDRSCEKWMTDYAIPGIDDLHLHHLYRAMAWLGEELEPAGEGGLAPRSRYRRRACRRVPCPAVRAGRRRRRGHRPSVRRLQRRLDCSGRQGARGQVRVAVRPRGAGPAAEQDGGEGVEA